MKIAIIGAGFTGLAAAYSLLKKGHEVTIFEKDNKPGGLAIGFQENNWEWTLEKHYHHWFTNDTSILRLAKEIDYEVLIKRPKTSVYINTTSYQLDSPLSSLTFPKLSFLERLRMISIFALLFKLNPFWQPLEKFRIATTLPKLIGEKAYNIIWKPQLLNKYGKYIQQISLVWFWARIAKRTTSLAYPKGGYLKFAEFLVKTISRKGGKISFNTEVVEITSNQNVIVRIKNFKGKQEKYAFDKAIVTLPTPQFLSITPQLPSKYKKQLRQLKGLGATNLVLRLKEQFMKDNTYWLSVCNTNSHIMVLVEHTNFIDKVNYNNEHIVYIGNYMSPTDKNFSLSKEELLKIYDPFLKKINPLYKKVLIGYELFKASFAQPLIPVNYSKIIPPFNSPVKNIYLANIQQIYPWDRGTNYAVELGEKIAKHILHD